MLKIIKKVKVKKILLLKKYSNLLIYSFNVSKINTNIKHTI